MDCEDISHLSHTKTQAGVGAEGLQTQRWIFKF